MKFKQFLQKIPDFIIFSLPLIFILIIVLFAYWPGILVSDSMVQWHEAQTGNISNWHPAYNTIYIMLLTKIINHPGFVLFVQLLILSLCIGSFLSKLKKYYNVNKIFLLICSGILAIIPLNFNSAVCLLKDTLYSVMLVLLASITIDIINQKDFFDKKSNNIKLGLTLLAVMLLRHNGILTVILFCIVTIFIYRKKYQIYITAIASIAVYLLMTTVGFTILNIAEGNYANKYGPISHIYARILNEDKESLSEKELEELSEFVDIELLEETFDPYNMDYSINAQNVEALKDNGSEYLKMGIKKFFDNPWVFIKHYIYLDSFLYSPVPFENSWVVGMFTETDLWVYEEQYSQLNENSKIPVLLNVLKDASKKFQEGDLGNITMRPALYMYLTLLISVIFSIYYKNPKIILIGIIPLFNTVSLAIAIPVAMTRYVYSTILLGYLFIIWAIYEVYIFFKRKLFEPQKTYN